MKWIIGIVALIVVVSVIGAITGSGGSGSGYADEEEAWVREFGPILSNVNRTGMEPARAMIDVQLCETISGCDLAFRNMADAFKPYRSSLLISLQGLPNTVPPKFELFQQGYRSMLELRLEAIDFYIRGVNEGNDELLEKGDERWREAVIAASDYLDQLEFIIP